MHAGFGIRASCAGINSGSHYIVLLIGERLLLTLWVGALWSIGYLAVPTLFATIPERELAGMVAGRMFTLVNYLGLFCGTLLLLGTSLRQGRMALRGMRVWLLGGMLLLVVTGLFLLQPQMASMKVAGVVAGTAAATAFERLHHLAAMLYHATSILGLLLLVTHDDRTLRAA